MNAQVIFQDDFSGAATSDLGGTSPDVSINGSSWITANSRGDAGAAQVFGADGSIIKDGPNSSHDAGALLAYSLSANTIYTLEATFNNNDSGWVALGFASSDAILDGVNGRHSNGSATAFGGYAWGLTRNNSGTDQEIFNGIGTGNPAAGGDFVNPAQPVDFRVVLDTTNTAAITAEYFFNGTQFGGTQVLEAAAFGNISFVGISSDGRAGGEAASITNFSLTAQTIPEPSSLAFLIAGGLAMLGRRRGR